MFDRLGVELLESHLGEPDLARLLELFTRLRWARDAIPEALRSGSQEKRDEVGNLLRDIPVRQDRVRQVGDFLPSARGEFG